MNCKEAQDIIMADYVDGELGADEAATLQAHLAVCPACREVAEQMKETARGLSLAPRVVLDQDKIWKNITEQISDRSEKSVIYDMVPQRSFWEAFRPRLGPALTMAALSLLLFVSLSHFGGGKESRQAEHQEEGEEVQTLAFVMEEMTEDLEDGYGTGLEAYFL